MNHTYNDFESTYKTIEEKALFNITSKMIKHLEEKFNKRNTELNKPIGRAECAKIMGVSLPTLDKYIRKEDIPYRIKNPNAKSRKHYVFFVNEVLEWQMSRLSDPRVNHGRSN